MPSLEDLTDTDLVRNARLGDREWLQELFRRYEGHMFGCAHRMVAPAEVEDAVQEIALRVMRGLPRFRGESSLSTWIYAVARHTCLDVRRRRRETVELPDSATYDDDAATTPVDAFDLSIMACRTATEIARLPRGQQDVVMLRLGAGMSTEATAKALGMSADAVKARLRRARATLRKHLAETVICPSCGPGAYSLDATGVVASTEPEPPTRQPLERRHATTESP